MMLSPSRTFSSSLTPSKSRARGRQMAQLLPFLNIDTVLMFFLYRADRYVENIRNIHSTWCVHIYRYDICRW